jgi:L-ascorbate metabolism protein UlaG (beta-lactamase superfamily)
LSIDFKRGPKVKLTIIQHDIKKWQALHPAPGQVTIWWLGQAGFALRYGGCALLIDPYLSDSLATKYKGQTFPHERMMPVPVTPQALPEIDWVLCTHRHSDHMDPATLEPLFQSSLCRVVVPCAVLAHVLENIGLTADRTICVNAGQNVILDKNIHLHPIPAAHETLTVNARGEHYFLGYILQLGDIRIYHSGDCVPYDNLVKNLQDLRPDIALLPVNDRDAYRRSHNVPGNFHFEEALQLCRNADIAYLIPHHYGMFEFNTVDPADLQKSIESSSMPLQIVLPMLNRAYCFSKS